MSLSELIALLQAGEASRDAQRRAAQLLRLWRPREPGRPRKLYWREAHQLLVDVETLTASLGSRRKAFEAIAAEAQRKGRRKHWTSVKRNFSSARAFEREQEKFADEAFSSMVDNN